jgi:DNA-binding NarL/FixJ family response regulator
MVAMTRASGEDPREELGNAAGRDGITVLIVDSEQALAQALAESLSHEPDIAGARSANGPRAAAEVMNAQTIDVVVAAMDCDGWDPLTFVRDLGRCSPDMVIVAMSGDDDPAQVTAAVNAGVFSWVPKQVPVRQLASVVVGASRGEASLPPAILMHVLRELTAGPGRGADESFLARLTTRERQILEHTARGLSRREIAARLHVSVNTVRTHSQHMLSKLGVHTTLEAVTLALREQALVEPERKPKGPTGSITGRRGRPRNRSTGAPSWS